MGTVTVVLGLSFRVDWHHEDRHGKIVIHGYVSEEIDNYGKDNRHQLDKKKEIVLIKMIVIIW